MPPGALDTSCLHKSQGSQIGIIIVGPIKFPLSLVKNCIWMDYRASKKFSQGNLRRERSNNVPSLSRVARKATRWTPDKHESWASVAWMSTGGCRLQALDEAPGHVGWLMRESVERLLIMCIFSLSCSSAFCFELFLSSSHTFFVFFQTCISKRERRSLLALETCVWSALVWKQSQMAKRWFRNYGGQKMRKTREEQGERIEKPTRKKQRWHSEKVRKARYNSHTAKSKISPASVLVA